MTVSSIMTGPVAVLGFPYASVDAEVAMLNKEFFALGSTEGTIGAF